MSNDDLAKLLGDVQALAALDGNDKINLIRKLETSVASERRLRKTADLKWKQAEKDLDNATRKIEFYEETTVPGKKLSVPKAKSRRPKKGKATALFCLCDWHSEETVDPDTVKGMNAYDLDICKKRLEKLWDKCGFLVEDARSISDVRDAVVWLGGDHITGYIHDELVEGNSLSPTEASLFFQAQAETGISRILSIDGIDRVTVLTSNGNHGRTTSRPRISTGWKNSYEWMAYNNIERVFRDDPRVQFQIARGYHNWLDIQGHACRFHHGDHMKYGGGVGGLTIPVNKKISQWDKATPARYDFFGHFHQFIWNWKWVSCGCLIGYNAYALSIGADPQPPTQTFCVIDKDRGLVKAMPIFVE